MRRHRVSTLLVAALVAACGGKETPPVDAPAEKPAATAPPAAAPKEDLAAALARAHGASKGPDEAPPAPTPKDPPAETASGGPVAPAPTGSAAPVPAAPAKPGKVPKSLAEITDKDALASFDEEEREAVAAMPEAVQRKFLDGKRMEIFLARGGVLSDSGRMEDQKVDEKTGLRGEGRPDAPKGEVIPVSLQVVMQALASPDPETRAAGAESARRYADKAEAAKFIGTLLTDKDPELRAIAAGTLGKLQQESSVPLLEERIAKEGSDEARTAMVRAIRDIGGAAGVASLRKMAREGEEPADRAAAIAFLTDMRDPSLVSDLIGAALQDFAADVRQAGVIAIRTHGLKGHGDALVKCLDDISEQVLVESVRALGVVQHRPAVPKLMRLLLKPDEEAEEPETQRAAASEALRKITGQEIAYDVTLPDADRVVALDAWRTWWEKNKATWK
jgi:hypothetical protein